MQKNVIDELKVIFMMLNSSLFEPHLPMPEFIEGKKNGILGFKLLDGKEVICIGKHFTDKDVQLRAIFDDLLHQMCHIKNHQAGIKDQTENGYHNKHFIKTAKSVGLTIKKDVALGCITSTTHCQLNCFCHECKHGQVCELLKPDKKIIEKTESVYVKIVDGLGTEILKSRVVDDLCGSLGKQYLFKYECSCSPPHNSIRSGRSPDGKHKLSIICQDCGKLFQCKSQKE